MDDGRRRHELRGRCTHDLWGHGPVNPIDHLGALPEEIDGDWYGAGGCVDQLEAEVADLLGKPAAVFMPSGTMAQQIALRLHCEAAGAPTVLAHPLMHPALHEDQPLERLHGLVHRPVGEHDRLVDVTDLQQVAEPAGVLLLELPQREIGSPLPTWEALTAQCTWAREHGVALHMDGARLWEAQPHYGRPLADIAELFDSVYVSFYKGLGAVGGAMLAGEHDLVAQAREWRHRLGGQMVMLWPLAASALACLHRRLELMPEYVARLRALSATLADIDGVRLRHNPPFTNSTHLYLANDADSVRIRAHELAAERGVCTWLLSAPAEVPGWTRVELTVGDATMQVPTEVITDAVEHLLLPVAPATPGEELVEVVDERGAITGVVTRRQIRAEGLRHRATYIAVLTEDDQLIVHRRSEEKDVNPGLWDLVFGGLCDVGENWADAAARELDEEAGIVGAGLDHLEQFAWDADDPDDGGKVVGRVFVARWDGPVVARDGEVAEFARVPLHELVEWTADHQICADTVQAVLPILLARLT